MIWTIVAILVVLWLIGLLGPRVSSGFPKIGNIVHVVIVIAIILAVLHLLGVL